MHYVIIVFIMFFVVTFIYFCFIYIFLLYLYVIVVSICYLLHLSYCYIIFLLYFLLYSNVKYTSFMIVYKITPCAGCNSYVEKDLEAIKEQIFDWIKILNIDDSFIVQTVEMPESVYNELPEYEGY